MDRPLSRLIPPLAGSDNLAEIIRDRGLIRPFGLVPAAY